MKRQHTILNKHQTTNNNKIKEANLKSIKEEMSQNDRKYLSKIVCRRSNKGTSKTEEPKSLKISSVPLQLITI